uniref:WSC domain-containing protein n=1 Tax=Corethron hystrix TaxID=216773 RepID=A0A7S1BSD5_9STRA|mmetsp:Transcript_39399/g.92004  ORF Transcript_39399/g.92004 Transcript_39399/m.92004 type:complete len:846 (+) Transcript_39399:144-2681(+)
MRLLILALTSIGLPPLAFSLDSPCFPVPFDIIVTKACTYDTVLFAYEHYFNSSVTPLVACAHSAEEDLAAILGVNETSSVEAEIMRLCSNIQGNIEFDQISYKDSQFTENFFAGGTYWNEEVETKLESDDGTVTNVLKDDAARVLGYYELAKREIIAKPDLPNFDLDQCNVNSAMCCWVTDRQANDNNGSCAKEYDENCVDKDPADNTDLCMVDLNRSPFSNKVASDGLSIFYGDDGNKPPFNAEGPVHCHGFAWADQSNHHSGRYKGNNLFYISMYDHMYKRGYVRNVPGAPMCGCVEHMPIVSRSDCTQIDVKESFKLTYDTMNVQITMESTDIDFNACKGVRKNNNLEEHYKLLLQRNLVTDEKFQELKKTIAGDHGCPSAIKSKLIEKGFFAGFSDPENWTHVVGKGSLNKPEITMGPALFRKAFGASINGIVRRVCLSCSSSDHKDIYYRRLTPLPYDIDLLDVLKNNWFDKNNTFNVDFALYSSYEEALADNEDNRWSSCNFNDPRVGFPRDCGPRKLVGNQWNSYVRGGATAYDSAFYLEAKHVDSSFQLTPLNMTTFGSAAVTYAVELNGTYYIQGKGEMAWNKNSDNLNFAYEDSPDEDFTVVSQLSSIERKGKWTTAGIMVRSSLENDSQMMYLGTSMETNGIFLQTRVGNGESSSVKHSYTVIKSPFFKLRRRVLNGEVTAHISSDGKEWEQIGEPVYMKGVLKVGMSTISDNDSTLSEAVFSNYEVVPELLTPSPTISAAPTRSPAPTTAFPKELGCFKDKGRRAMPVRKGSGNMNQCIINCNGYTYAGRQWAGECWCANSGYDKYGREPSGCNCNGSNVGAWRNCVYQITSS